MVALPLQNEQYSLSLEGHFEQNQQLLCFSGQNLCSIQLLLCNDMLMVDFQRQTMMVAWPVIQSMFPIHGTIAAENASKLWYTPVYFAQQFSLLILSFPEV